MDLHIKALNHWLLSLYAFKYLPYSVTLSSRGWNFFFVLTQTLISSHFLQSAVQHCSSQNTAVSQTCPSAAVCLSISPAAGNIRARLGWKRAHHTLTPFTQQNTYQSTTHIPNFSLLDKIILLFICSFVCCAIITTNHQQEESSVSR